MRHVFTCARALLLAISMFSRLAKVTGLTMELHRMPKQDIHPETYARRLSAQDVNPEIVPLHLGLGTHYTWVYVGTPPQRASVIVDTGSALTAFPCSGCDGCGNHTDQPFNTDNSSTLVHITCSQQTIFRCSECRVPTNTCTFSQSYLEGSSWKASVVEDIVFLGGDASFEDEALRNTYGTHFQFGCQSSETGLFVTQVADGIMGMSNTNNHIVAKLHRENKISSNLFSLCFLEDGGTMSIGQPHTSAHRGEISYAKTIADRSAGQFYSVHMKDVRIGGKSINAKEEAFTRGHYIVDSGTTDSYLSRLLQTEFLDKFKEVSGHDYMTGNSCKGYTNEELTSLPSIQLAMEAYGDGNREVVLEIPPEQYLFHSGGKYCANLYLSENSGGVIGANLMMNRDVIFDIGNQRLGFVDANCAYNGAPNSTIASVDNKTTSISEGTEKEKAAATIHILPNATSVVADSHQPNANATPAVPTPEPTPAMNVSKPANTTLTPAKPTPKPISAPVTSNVTATPPVAPPTNTITNTSLHTEISSNETVQPPPATPIGAPVTSNPTVPSSSSFNSSPSAAISKIQPLPNDTTLSTSSANMEDGIIKEKPSGTHPLVLTIVGAVLVVGFLVMMLISVGRRRQKSTKDQLWSRVKGDEEDEDDDDEEEFGVVRNDKKKRSTKPTTKHQRLNQEEEEDGKDQQSSSDEEDEVFERKAFQEEAKVDTRTLERL